MTTNTASKGNRFAFTKRAIDKLPVPSEGRNYYYDEGQAGLALCITATDKRTFYLARRIEGRYERVLIGRYPEVTIEQARKQAAAWQGKIAEGQNPQAERLAKRREHTLEGLFAHWLEHAQQHKRTWAEDKRQFEKLLSSWHKRRLSAITKADVQALHHRIGKKHGQYAANRLLALLRAMFNRADDIGYRGLNPARGVKKFTEQSRDRFLRPEEVPAFFAALEAEEQIFQDFFLVSLLTGARRGNVMAMAWADVHLDAAAWRIPTTKHGEPVLVHLPDKAVEILRRRKAEADGSPFVFASHSQRGHIVEPKAAWKRIVKRAGLEDIRIHDLRRTLGSWQAIAGSSLTVIGQSLGHKSLQSTAVYARLTHEPVAASVNQATSAILAASKPAKPKRQRKAKGRAR